MPSARTYHLIHLPSFRSLGCFSKGIARKLLRERLEKSLAYHEYCVMVFDGGDQLEREIDGVELLLWCHEFETQSA